MDILIFFGALVTLLGLIGLIWCIVRVAKARRSGVDEQTLRDIMQHTIAFNMGALFVSVIGLMMVVLGILLS